MTTLPVLTIIPIVSYPRFVMSVVPILPAGHHVTVAPKATVRHSSKDLLDVLIVRVKSSGPKSLISRVLLVIMVVPVVVVVVVS